MERKKYFYNPKTLSFVEEKVTLKDRVLKLFGFGTAVLFTAVLLLLLSTDYITTPKEKKLQEKFDRVNYDLEAITADVTNLNKQIDKLQERDANVHRIILGMDPMDETQWNTGVGGSKKYKNYMSFNNSSTLIRESLERIDLLKRKVDMQNSSLDTLERLARVRSNKLAAVPSIKPVREDKLRSKMAYLSGYGWRTHPIFKIRKFHKGLDFTAASGTPIQATGNGIVREAGSKRGGYGKHVVIDHGYGYRTMYAHLSKIMVKPGQRIKRGQTIGLIGSTGTSTAPHCHYEVFYKGKNVNPIDYVYDGMTPEEYQHFVEKASVENMALD
ncbi:MAG: M23 family metallopeptidase [Deltaproteobacteria bacterium]